MSDPLCHVCGKPIIQGQLIQGFLRCPEDREGRWTSPVLTDACFSLRHGINQDKVRRKHLECTA